MPTFTDIRGRSWVVAITVGTLRKARAAGFDMAKAIGPGRPMADLVADPEAFGTALWLVCDPAATGVSEDEFFAGLDGPTLERAALAFLVAVADFTQPSRVAKAAGPKIREGWDKTMAAVADQVTAWDPATPWPSPSASPGSSESTPTRSASAT